MKHRLVALLGLFTLSACAATRTVSNFKALSDVSHSFETVAGSVIDYSAAVSIDEATRALAFDRARLLTNNRPPSAAEQVTLRTAIEQRNAVDAQSISLRTSLKESTVLLGDYFATLNALASFDGASTIGTSTGNLMTALTGLDLTGKLDDKRKEQATNLGTSLGQLIVAQGQSHMLTEELRSNGPLVVRQLQMQALALEQIADELEGDQRRLSRRALTSDVVEPYATADTMPSDWQTRRRDILLSPAEAAQSARRAAAVSRRLAVAFTNLAAGRADVGELASLALETTRLSAAVAAVVQQPK